MSEGGKLSRGNSEFYENGKTSGHNLWFIKVYLFIYLLKVKNFIFKTTYLVIIQQYIYIILVQFLQIPRETLFRLTLIWKVRKERFFFFFFHLLLTPSNYTNL